jgi:hypothetical protein
MNLVFVALPVFFIVNFSQDFKAAVIRPDVNIIKLFFRQNTSASKLVRFPQATIFSRV